MLNKNEECEDFDLKNQITKSTELVLNLTKKNNDLIYQIITSFVKDISKEIRTFDIQFQGMNVTLKIWQYFVPNFLSFLLHYYFDCSFDWA